MGSFFGKTSKDFSFGVEFDPILKIESCKVVPLGRFDVHQILMLPRVTLKSNS
jgi:hypothetical protein